MTTPLRAVKVKTFSAATVAGLETAMNSWIDSDAGQRKMVSCSFDVVGGNAVAYLLYTE